MSQEPKFSRAHEGLGDQFSDPVEAAVFPQHMLRYRNDTAAQSVGLHRLTDVQWVSHFGRFESLSEEAQPSPLALRYHGHQFQHYNPDLGDGRGFLFAQLYDLTDGRLLDLGTKGSGTTPYSRSGDGRLTLKGAVREAMATAFLRALGVNTSKTLSIVETGEQLFRGDEPSPTRSAVLVRLSHSHVRFGTFQRLNFEGNTDALAKLIDHCLKHYYPGLARTGDVGADALTLLTAVVDQKAKTVAQWMAAGFVHGVLNTDNMNISGESFDYGPYRFLPAYDPGFTAAYFDHSGLYAYGRQPSAVIWNLQQLAGTLTHFASQQDLVAILQRYSPCLEQEIANAMFRRFGVKAPQHSNGKIDLDQANSILTQYFEGMRATGLTFQAPFFDLHGGGSERLADVQASSRGTHYSNGPLGEAARAICELPRNTDAQVAIYDAVPDLLLPDIETIWDRIAQQDDWTAFKEKIAFFDELQCLGHQN